MTSWGDSTGFTHTQPRQPCGFKREHVLATAMDPRSKGLYGIDEDEHPAVWDAVANEAVKVAMEAKAAEGIQAAGASSSPIAVETAADPQPQRRRGFAAASAAHGARQQSAAASSSGSREQMESIVKREVDAFKTTPGLAAIWTDEKGQEIRGKPLEWWRVNAREYPMLALLARRVLCIPASQAQSERVFSSAGLVVTKTRSRLDPENVELMVFLRNILPEVDRWNGNGNKRKGDEPK